MSASGKTLKVISAAGVDEVIVASELANISFPKEGGLSLLAWKLLVQILDKAGPRICDVTEHRAMIAELNWAHRDQEFIENAVRELQRTIVEITIETKRGKVKKSGPILTDVIRDEDAVAGELVWDFSKTFRAVVKSSRHWAAIGARALLHMDCKYSPPLYLLMSLYAGRRHNTVEFPLHELRKRLGATNQSLKRWINFKNRVLEPAIAEVNHLTGIRVEWRPLKQGRRVEAVQFTAWKKTTSENRDTDQELERPKIGRKTRRENVVELLSKEQRSIRNMAEKSLRGEFE